MRGRGVAGSAGIDHRDSATGAAEHQRGAQSGSATADDHYVVELCIHRDHLNTHTAPMFRSRQSLLPTRGTPSFTSAMVTPSEITIVSRRSALGSGECASNGTSRSLSSLGECCRKILGCGDNGRFGLRAEVESAQCCALSATTTVDTLMRMPPTAGASVIPPRQTRRRRADRDHVVPGCPHEVLQHLLVARLRQTDDAHGESWVRAGEDDARGFDRDIGPGADGDADIGTRRAPGRRSRRRRPSRPASRGLGARRRRAPCRRARPPRTPRRCRAGRDVVGDLLRVAGDHDTRAPKAWSSATAWRDSGRISSSSATAPTMCRRATYRTDAPPRSKRDGVGERSR